jgi:hypothetical protein
MKMRRVDFVVLVLSLCAGLVAVPAAEAQSVAATSCAAYKDADKDPARQALFQAYLQGYANASSPDPRYTTSDAALADGVRQVRDWCGKNSNSTYAQAVAAVLGSAPCSGPAPAGPVYAQPTSCRVGPTTYCAGCGVTCSAGKQATCTPGRDSEINQWCGRQSQCVCK